jgi:hypothetical protein
LAAQFNAWQRLGRLPPSDALSIIIPIPKADGDPSSCSSLRGIAVGSQAIYHHLGAAPAQLGRGQRQQGRKKERKKEKIRPGACIEEASWILSRAEGQLGFRRKRSTAQAVFVLRALQDQHRSSGQQLFACFVNFQRSYDTVSLLWEKLHAAGLGGEWLRAVQALYRMQMCLSGDSTACQSPSRPA